MLFEKSSATYLINGSIAQLGEHLPYKQGVTGSIPVTPTIYAGMAELADALDLGSSDLRSWGFDSLCLHHIFLRGKKGENPERARA